MKPWKLQKVSLLALLCLSFFCYQCKPEVKMDGRYVETYVLDNLNVSRDTINHQYLRLLLDEINCADSTLFGKKLVLSDNFHSKDTSEILVIPYVPSDCNYDGPAFSNVEDRFLLLNLRYIREFTIKNTLGDSSSFRPVVALTLLHEVGHFMMSKTGHFDTPCQIKTSLGEQKERTEPQFLTKIKKIELSADSLAIAIVKKGLHESKKGCVGIAMDVQRILPGMQFQMSGMRVISNFGDQRPIILFDPGNSHPNMELRITFMNYFLFPTPERRHLIDDYIYNRTVVSVHEQELAPHIFQGREKLLSDSIGP